jgi:hypothetical protein
VELQTKFDNLTRDHQKAINDHKILLEEEQKRNQDVASKSQEALDSVREDHKVANEQMAE